MNRSMIRYLLAKLLLIEAIFLVFPLVVALIYKETTISAYLLTIGILLVLGSPGIFFKPKDYHIYSKEGLLIVALCWLLWSFFGSLPFVFSGQIPDMIDAFFEASSGFTTTGASIVPDLSLLNPSLIFWRGFTHLIGGMGVLVFALAIMNNSKNAHLEVMRAEVPGPVFGKIVAKLKNTAQILYLLYLVLFVILVICLKLAGMPLFDSIVVGMSTAGTGGFAVHNDSIAHYHNSTITAILTMGKIIFGINFNLYFYLLLGKVKSFFRDEELRAYFVILFTATALIAWNAFGTAALQIRTLNQVLFQVSSIMTSTGFWLLDTSKWPLFSQFVLLGLMFIGGTAGSTSGGFKVIRIVILSRIAKNQILATLYPNRIQALTINQQALDRETQRTVLTYLTVYLLVLVSLVGILSLDQSNFLTVVSSAVSALNNIGPILGTNESFAIYSPISKLLLSIAMIAGRLELYPMLLLFHPRTWSKL